MRRKDVVQKLLKVVRDEVGDSVNVRTVGGDQQAGPPEVVLDYLEQRSSGANGHTPYAGAKTDENGHKVEKEYHSYWSVEADFRLRYKSESMRDVMVDDVQAAFLPIEDDSDRFHEDTREWEVSSSGPRENSVLEPDWYSAGVLVTFEYIKRVTADEDTLEQIYVRDIDIEDIE